MKTLNKGFKIVENTKKILIAPIVIILITAIMLLIFGITTGEPVKVGTDFTGGYKMRVSMGNRLTDENYESYSQQIVGIAENLTDENGNLYGISIKQVERYGENNDSIAISYLGVGEDEYMSEVVNPALKQALEEEILAISPNITYSSNQIVAAYDGYLLNGNIGDIKADALRKEGVAIESYEISDNSLVFNVSGNVTDEKKTVIKKTLAIMDEYSGNVASSGYVSSTVSDELLWRAVLAVSIAIVCMLIYITIRFQFLSGLAAIIALFHDLVIMMCGMFIFHIEINQTIIAALITILGYSINNTIIIFDRVRENIKLMPSASNAEIINTSVKDTMSRTICTTLTTLIMIALIAMIGVSNVQVFALPIIFGLLAGFYSANFIAPVIWAWLSNVMPSKRRGVSKKA